MNRLFCFRLVPHDLQGIVRAAINSEQEADRITAMAYCWQYQIDYPIARGLIAYDMVYLRNENEGRHANEQSRIRGTVYPATGTSRPAPAGEQAGNEQADFWDDNDGSR
jgi:hypothetical protein